MCVYLCVCYLGWGAGRARLPPSLSWVLLARPWTSGCSEAPGADEDRQGDSWENRFSRTCAHRYRTCPSGGTRPPAPLIMLLWKSLLFVCSRPLCDIRQRRAGFRAEWREGDAVQHFNADLIAQHLSARLLRRLWCTTVWNQVFKHLHTGAKTLRCLQFGCESKLANIPTPFLKGAATNGYFTFWLTCRFIKLPCW